MMAPKLAALWEMQMAEKSDTLMAATMADKKENRLVWETAANLGALKVVRMVVTKAP